jgi:Prokaryotic RING finger family 1
VRTCASCGAQVRDPAQSFCGQCGAPAPVAGAGGEHHSDATATAEMAGRSCPYCRFPLKEGTLVKQCGSCGSVHHNECWDENGGCAVTACEAGPKQQATQVLPPSPPPGAPPQPVHPSSSAPSSDTQRRVSAGLAVALAVVVLILGAGVALAFTSGGGGHPSTIASTPVTQPETTESTPTETAPTESTPTETAPPETTASETPSTETPPTTAPPPAATSAQSSQTPSPSGPVDAVNEYWSDIEHHDFAGAFSIEQPVAKTSESSWVKTEEEEGVENVSYNFTPGSENGDEATVEISSLRTEASKTGCYTWSGEYGMTRYGSSWKITHDGLERHSC